MTLSLIDTMLWAAAIGGGLMAGIYLAFSTFIMRSFATLSPAHAIDAMNAINRVILRSPFMPLFFGTSLAALGLALAALLKWQEPYAMHMLVAGTVYVIGMFTCTALFNVPLNNRLERIDRGKGKAADWQYYLLHWTRWNHVRTLSSFVSCVLCIYLLLNLD